MRIDNETAEASAYNPKRTEARQSRSTPLTAGKYNHRHSRPFCPSGLSPAHRDGRRTSWSTPAFGSERTDDPGGRVPDRPHHSPLPRPGSPPETDGGPAHNSTGTLAEAADGIRGGW